MKRIAQFALLVCVVACAGCASMINQAKKDIKVESNPTGAPVVVYDLETDKVVERARTPATITLNRGAGYFKGANYRLTVGEGQKPAEVWLKPRITGWYWGNFGLWAGFVLVDPQTGSMWTLYPEYINADLKTGQITTESPTLLGTKEETKPAP